MTPTAPANTRTSNDDGIQTRAAAIRILERWMRTSEFPDRMIYALPARMRGFTMELVYATVRWSRLLDAVVSERLRHPPPPEAEAALLLGTCQLLKLPHIPEYAALHATVEAYKGVTGRRAAAPLVNAILRGILRERGGVLAAIEKMPPALRLSHPDELVERWTARWGESACAAMCDWNNTPAGVTVLTLPHGPDIVALRTAFEDAGIAFSLHEICAEALEIAHGQRVEQLPGFAEGHFAVQDPGTLEAVRLLDVRPGQRVLDACAAPGGKAARLARLLFGGRDAQDGGQLVAMERHDDRLPQLRETLERLAPAGDIKIVLADATQISTQSTGGEFDRVLLDVPCSNSGVLRRRPDARWRFSVERLHDLGRLQAALLEAGARVLKTGGRLVYSTCSLEREENESQIEKFLDRHPEFAQVECSQLTPPGTDGAFAAAIVRNK